MKPVDFLDREGQEMVVNAIREAEKNTSGEIRVHIDDVCETDAYEKAVEVFRFLGMDRTAEKNAVLIYVACNSKVFAIVGDKGINEAVPEHFWTDIISMVREKFAAKTATIFLYSVPILAPLRRLTVFRTAFSAFHKKILPQL